MGIEVNRHEKKYDEENVRIARKNATSKFLLKKGLISAKDAEMDKRASAAVKAAISRIEIKQKPIAHYDATTDQAFLEYPNKEEK